MPRRLLLAKYRQKRFSFGELRLLYYKLVISAQLANAAILSRVTCEVVRANVSVSSIVEKPIGSMSAWRGAEFKFELHSRTTLSYAGWSAYSGECAKGQLGKLAKLLQLLSCRQINNLWCQIQTATVSNKSDLQINADATLEQLRRLFWLNLLIKCAFVMIRVPSRSHLAILAIPLPSCPHYIWLDLRLALIMQLEKAFLSTYFLHIQYQTINLSEASLSDESAPRLVFPAQSFNRVWQGKKKRKGKVKQQQCVGE